MLRLALTLLPLLLACGASRADNCEAIRSQIESRIKAGGVASFTLVTVDAGASAAGKLVGTCALGAKKILYGVGSPAPGATAGAKPARRESEAMLTECRDGSMSLGGDCKR
jgi:Protein of unknown function (DUF1161)